MPKPYYDWHQEMLSNTSACQRSSVTLQQLEKCFSISNFTWEKVKAHVEIIGFISTQQEIRFYKYIKPCFTGYIEFYCMLYGSLTFVPQSREDVNSFWRHELTRFDRFKNAFTEIVDYIEMGCTTFDDLYFLASNNDLHNARHAKVYDADSSLCARFDYIGTGLIAHKLFAEFIIHKISD